MEKTSLTNQLVPVFIIHKIFRIPFDDSIMCGILLDYIKLFSPNDYQK